MSCYPKRKQVVELLIRKGAQLNEKNKDFLTPLHVAADMSHFDIMEALLRLGAKVNALDALGQTGEPIFYLSSFSFLIWLVNMHEILPNLLHWFYQIFSLITFSWFFKHLLHLNHHWALQINCFNFSVICKIFRELSELSALHRCAREDNVQGCQILLSFNVDTSIVSLQGYTALTVAQESAQKILQGNYSITFNFFFNMMFHSHFTFFVPIQIEKFQWIYVILKNPLRNLSWIFYSTTIQWKCY